MFPHHRDGGDPLTRHNYYNYVNIIIYYERRSVSTILYIIFSYNIHPRTTRGVHIIARSQYIKLNPRYTYIIITKCVTRGTMTVSPTTVISSLSV